MCMRPSLILLNEYYETNGITKLCDFLYENNLFPELVTENDIHNRINDFNTFGDSSSLLDLSKSHKERKSLSGYYLESTKNTAHPINTLKDLKLDYYYRNDIHTNYQKFLIALIKDDHKAIADYYMELGDINNFCFNYEYDELTKTYKGFDDEGHFEITIEQAYKELMDYYNSDRVSLLDELFSNDVESYCPDLETYQKARIKMHLKNNEIDYLYNEFNFADDEEIISAEFDDNDDLHIVYIK